MKKATRNTFKRLEESRSSKRYHMSPELIYPSSNRVSTLKSFNFITPYTGFAGSRTTLEKFAEELHMPVDLLIKQFYEAGIRGLSPEHKVEQKHKDTLLAHLRAKHGVHTEKAESSLYTENLYEAETILPPQIELVQEINERLLFELAKDPTLMRQLHPRKFEEFVARLFEDQGYRVTLTPQTRDGGCDLIAELSTPFSSFLVMAECKRYHQDNKVGVEVVRGLYGVTEARRANQGLVITSSFFTKDAQEEKRLIGARIQLKDYKDLVNWLEPYSRRIS